MNEKDIQKSNQQVRECKIFIGNIHNRTTKQDLKRVFSKYGKVDKCFIIYHHKTKQSRGFGFVEFVHKSSVENVIASNGSIVLHGNTLACKRVELKKDVIEKVKLTKLF